MKRQIRQEGISLGDRTFREVGQRAKDINDSGDLKEPTTVTEILEIYLRMFKELTTARISKIETMISTEKTEEARKSYS